MLISFQHYYSPKKEVRFIISSDMSCQNRTLNNRGFLWTTGPAVAVAVGTDVDDSPENE
jgi:hypothetical protein